MDGWLNGCPGNLILGTLAVLISDRSNLLINMETARSRFRNVVEKVTYHEKMKTTQKQSSCPDPKVKTNTVDSVSKYFDVGKQTI